MNYVTAPPAEAVIPLTTNCARAFTLEHRDSAGQRQDWPPGAAVTMQIGDTTVPAALSAYNASIVLPAALCDTLRTGDRFQVLLSRAGLDTPLLIGRFARHDG